jgi:hypothetical protein
VCVVSQLSSWDPTKRLEGRSIYFQLTHLLFSTVAVAVSATRQLLSGIDGDSEALDATSQNSADISIGESRSIVHPSPLDHVARTGPLPCLVLIFIDVLLRVLRLAVFLSATHLQSVSALSFLGVWGLITFAFLWPFHKARRRDRCFIHDAINPFMILLSPWCMFAALGSRPYFSTGLYVYLGVLETIGMTAIYAAPLIGVVPLLGCAYDVIGICETDIVPRSCFPRGLAVAFASVWAASVLLWLWAGVVMLVGSRRDRMKL